jgi:hypothetical protein
VAYVSNDAGVTANYTNTAASVNYFYRDITVPAGETKIVLTFNWSGAGEDGWDSYQVFTAPTTVNPAAIATSGGSFASTPVPAGVAGATSIGFGSIQTGVQTATYTLPASLAGTTFRLIFSWRNDTSGGSSPAAAIDNISLTSLVPFNSIANGNWNDPTIWNKGVVPSCTDDVNIVGGFNVTVNSAANISKSVAIASGSTLTVASGDLTVGCTLNNNLFANNGTLTVTGGTLNVNGNMLHAAGSTFNQSGGDINVDGNNAGAAATSVASGTALVQINTQFLNWTGGMLTVVDPHANSTASNSFTYNNSTANVNVTTGHTLRFGDGVSTNSGGNATNGFRISTFAGSNRITFNNLIINGGTGTNRFVSTTYGFGVNGDLTVNANSEFRDNAVIIYVAKNLVNNGTYISTGTMYLGTFLGGTAGATTNAQTISGTGVFSNNVTVASATAKLTSVTVNNTNATGVTLSLPLSLSGTLTLTAGKVITTTANLLTVGTATASGTITGGSATAYINGPLARTIANANTNTTYLAFPVGKAAYAPISLAPATTAVTVMKAEAFDTNTGTADASIINLTANRRWEAPLVSGTFTSLNVRLGDTNITANKIPVQAPAAAGAYSTAFGSVATYAAGTPNTTTSTTAITAANYTGFLSFAESNTCSGTPAPGNTIASANNICLGTTVNFSVQNATAGAGVTYQWQSSSDNVTYNDIASATATTYSTTPSASLYYRLKVTCSAGPATGYSTPVQVTFASSIASSTPAARCGVGTVSLSATGSAGTSVKWYAAATGGAALATGTTFVTPSLTATTTYYAGALTPVAGTAGVGAATTTTTTSEELSAFNNRRVSLKSQTIYTAAQLTAAGVLPGNIVSIAYNIISNGSATSNTNYTVKLGTTTGTAFSNTTYLDESGFTTVYGPATYTHAVGLNTITFTTPFPWDGTSNIVIAVTQNGIDSSSNAETTYTDAGANATLFNFNDLTATTGSSTTKRLNVVFGGQVGCGSPRVPVIATVNTPPTITLSATPNAICIGQTTTAVTITAGAGSYDTFVWTPSTGVTGNSTTGWTFSPTTTTTYSLTASQTGGTMCVAPAISIPVTVNPLPGTMSIAASPINACAESVTPLTVTGGNITGTAVIGTATTLTTDTEQPTAFCNRWPNYWSQTIYTAAELTAAGLTPGNITSLAFNIATLGDGDSNADYTIKIGTTTATNFANTTFLATTSYTTVYGPQTYTHTANGQQVITFSTPFPWDGTSNLVVNITHSGADALNNSQTYYTTTTDDTVLWKYSFDGSTTTGTLSKKRLNLTLQSSQVLPVTWSPVTNLYTNAAATTVYTAGTNAKTVYFKSSAASPAVTYTATATTATSCTRTATVDVTVTSTPAPTVAAPTQDICNAGTIANLVATGTAIKWYAASVGGTPLAATTPLVNGTPYFASQTVGGCESLSRVSLTPNINVVAAPAVPNATPEFCNAATVADLLPNGANIKWYAGSAGGTALTATTAIVSGTPYYASQTVNGCEGLLRATVTPTINVVAAPAISNDAQVFCNNATVADLLPNGAEIKWYTSSTGGTALLATDVLVSGTPYFASQTVNGCEGLLRGTVTATVLVTPAPNVDDVDQVFCNAATVADLLPNTADIKWYSDETGGTALLATDALVNGNSYWASRTIDGCEGLLRTEVAVTVNVTPVPTGDDEQEFCDAALVSDLVAEGNTITWYDAETDGNAITVDTALTDGTIYYAAQIIDGCASATRLAVTAVIHTVAVDAPEDVSVCAEYVLPALTSGAYFTEAGGQGIELAAGSVISDTTTLYVYAQEGNDVVCSDENSFIVTVANIEAPTGDDTQTISVTAAEDATIADLQTDTATGTVTWYASEDDAQAGTNPLAADTQLVQGATYYATQTVGTCTSVETFAVTVDVVLDREAFDVKSFTYHPNPVVDILNLSYSSEITSVTVFNLLGQQVIAQQSNATEVKIDMSSLAAGAYIVNVTSGSTVKTIKVIKKQ